MKKILALILAIIMTMTLLAACGAEEPKNEATQPATTEAAEATEEVEATDAE